jgi:hypothetical protein
MKRILKYLGWLMLTLCSAFVLAISFPQSFFVTSANAGNLTLHSDRPFLSADGERVLRLAQTKLAATPLYVGQQEHHIFVSHSAWRRMLLLSHAFYAGGINYYPLTTNVFLRGANIELNRLKAPSGNPVPGSRTLDYYIAHEITHTLTGQSLGVINYYQLPRWKREGFADYVAKGSSFDFAEAVRALRKNDWRMDYERSRLYWRDHLLVSYLLDKCHWDAERLFSESIDEQAVEDAIRRDTPIDTLHATCENART